MFKCRFVFFCNIWTIWLHVLTRPSIWNANGLFHDKYYIYDLCLHIKLLHTASKFLLYNCICDIKYFNIVIFHNTVHHWQINRIKLSNAYGSYNLMLVVKRITLTLTTFHQWKCIWKLRTFRYYNPIYKWTNMRVQCTRTQQLRAPLTTTLGHPHSTQCNFNSCSFNY